MNKDNGAEPLRIAVVSLLPELVKPVARFGVTGRAVSEGLAALSWHNPRDYAPDIRGTVDDRPYGGGPGMVMTVQPLRDAIAAARKAAGRRARTVLLSPQGELLTQPLCEQLVAQRSLVLVCGRYEGVDERLVEEDIDLELSIGDFVLSGGEPAATVVIDALVRLLPGALGHADSARQDSFSDGLLDHPHYTRPEQESGRGVPAVLLSGDHGAIARWRMKQALGRTWLRRPELLDDADLNEDMQSLLQEFIAEQGVPDADNQATRSEP